MAVHLVETPGQTVRSSSKKLVTALDCVSGHSVERRQLRFGNILILTLTSVLALVQVHSLYSSVL